VRGYEKEGIRRKRKKEAKVWTQRKAREIGGRVG
jgi:hypothetical protein